MGNLNFDSTETPPKNLDFEPVEPGRYLSRVVDSEVKPTRDGLGLYLALTFELDEPGFEGKKVFTNLNIKNKSAKAEQIAKGMLSALCRACGKIGIVDDSSDLHDLPVIIKVTIAEASGDYAAKNEVKGFYPVEKGAPVVKATAAAQPITDLDSDELPI